MKVLMGIYNPDAPPKRTALGITYYAYGLDEYPDRRITKKSVGRMVKAGVEGYIIAEFEPWALRLPDELSIWIDQAYTERLEAWRACVGRDLPNGDTISNSVLNRVTPQSFVIKLHPAPFPVVQGVLTAGAAWSDRVEVVIAYLDNDNTWLRKCDGLIAWELGNMIARRHGFSPQDSNIEIGDKAPC